MDPEAALLDSELEKQILTLQSASEPATQGRTLAIITVLFSRCSADSQIAAAGSAVPHIAHCLTVSDQVVQANACAALTAAASLDDQIAAAVAAEHTNELIELLQACCSSDRADVQLNVVSALGQLARDQGVTAQALMQPQALTALLSLADASQPAKLQEAVTDSLCALASHDWARQQLVEAGVVQSAAELLNVQHLEVSVRLLMVLGMLLPSNPAAAQQLAGNPAGLQQLMELLKQGEDMDCKIIARDILGVLMKDESLRKKVEMAVRHAAQAAAAAGGAEGAKQ